MNFSRNEEQRFVKREVSGRKKGQQLEIDEICILNKFMTFTTLSFVFHQCYTSLLNMYLFPIVYFFSFLLLNLLG